MALQNRKLENEEVATALVALPHWKIAEGQLTREFRFETYKDGLVFAIAVGYAAERLNHHPDLTIGYGRVKVQMHTHDVGGLSPFDFELATRIEAL